MDSLDDLLYDYAKYWNIYSNAPAEFKLEHDIIKLADKISGVNFCFEQCEMGNLLFNDILAEYNKVFIDLSLINQIFNNISREFIIEINKIINKG